MNQTRGGKWLFFLPADDMDRVWPVLGMELQKGELGQAHFMKVGPDSSTDTKFVCCVYMEDCFDPEQVERVRSSLQTVLSSLVNGLELRLKPDSYTCCGVYRHNPWNLPVTLALSKVQGSAGPRQLQQHDQYQLKALVEAAELDSWEAVQSMFEDPGAREAMMDSLHAIALQPNTSDFPVLKVQWLMSFTWKTCMDGDTKPLPTRLYNHASVNPKPQTLSPKP